MNKIFRFLTVAILAVCTLCVSSCNKDDDDSGDVNPAEVKKAIIGTWVLNQKESVFKMEPKMGNDEGFSFGEITFNEDGTFSAVNDEDNFEGTYEINGTDIALTYQVDGKTVVLKKGADMSDVLEMDGGLDELFKMSISVDKCTAVANGDKLNILLNMKGSVDLGEFGEDMGLAEGSNDFTMKSDMKFDRKK